MENAERIIEQGNAAIQIRIAPRRIVAALVSPNGNVLKTGCCLWESCRIHGIWTYGQDEIIKGLRACYSDLAEKVKREYRLNIKLASQITVSAMKYGYFPFDSEGNQLVSFRTWKNHTAGKAAARLAELFACPVPDNLSAAHLYQAVLNQEGHVKSIAYLTTLSGYVHWRLTGEKVTGAADAAGMFPLGFDRNDYDRKMLEKFHAAVSDKNFPWKLQEILPAVRTEGQNAGALTKEGAALLDPSGNLQAGTAFAPPKGEDQPEMAGCK